MQIQTWLMLGILVVMFALLVWDRFRSWLVFMGALTAAMTLRLAPPDALLNGFGTALNGKPSWCLARPWAWHLR
jgi:hypothetical protein